MDRRPLRDPAPQSLEARISAALSDAGITSAALAALYNEVATAITAAASAADQAKTRALDPTIADPAAARARRDDAVYRLERLRAALPPLQQRYNEVRLAERRAQWRADYAQIKAKRDATAEKLQAIYELTEQLIEVLEEAKQVDEDVARINSTAPNGEHDRLLTVECAARGVNGVGPNGLPSLLTDLKLPRWSAPGWAWPPPPPAIDVMQVVPAALLTHPGGDWHSALQQRDAARQQEAARVANYHRQREREQEDMENARARAEQVRRQQAST
jgi:hypothetical protein